MRRAALATACALCTAPASADPDAIARAANASPSAAYGHDALGPGQEWTAIRLDSGDAVQSFRLPDSLFFEDAAPRLADLDGDGGAEAIAVESHRDRGSRLAVWNARGRVAATPFIGRRHRWLAPLGAADLDGDGRTEIAYVETPHVAPTLKLVRLGRDRLVPVAQASGLTNHRFGDPFIQGRIALCGGRPTILTANAGWQRVMATTFDGSRLTTVDAGRYARPDSFARIRGCS